ncbi:MAG: drug/metabolite transporter (DMT)-like permease, partial [Verrucomicrobiales bacterium]
VVLWSTGNMIVRGTDLTGPQIAFWRYLISAVLYAVAYRRFVGPLFWADFKIAAPVGVILAIEVAVFFVAIKSTTVANVTVIGSLSPLLLFGVAARRFNERISLRVIAAAALALGGVVAVVFGSAEGATWSLKGDALAVLALLFFAAYFVVGKVARESLSGLALQAHSLIAGVPVLALTLLIDSGGMPVPAGGQWWFVIGLVIFPTTGHFLVNWAHAHVSLTLVSLMTLGVPVLSILAAAVLYDETIVGMQVAGIVVVLIVLSLAIVETSRLDVTRE